MKAKYQDGQTLYVTHMIIGTEFYTGTRVEVVESYSERGSETRYLVRKDGSVMQGGGFKAYVYESDLSTVEPLDRSEA